MSAAASRRLNCLKRTSTLADERVKTALSCECCKQVTGRLWRRLSDIRKEEEQSVSALAPPTFNSYAGIYQFGQSSFLT